MFVRSLILVRRGLARRPSQLVMFERVAGTLEAYKLLPASCDATHLYHGNTANTANSNTDPAHAFEFRGDWCVSKRK